MIRGRNPPNADLSSDMATEQLTVNFARPKRLFPLPTCVLLPSATVPLHVFESRYRAMLRDALDSDGLIAMAVHDPERAGVLSTDNPTLRPIVCLGYVAEHQRLEDGRYNIALHGLCRARIVEEQPLHDDGYRSAELEPFGTHPDTLSDTLDEGRQRIEALLEDEYLRTLTATQALRKLFENELPTSAVVDLALLTIASDSEQRYAALAEGDAERRLQMLERQLRSMRDVITRAERFAHRDDHGWPLN